jgi:hypothetical protein
MVSAISVAEVTFAVHQAKLPMKALVRKSYMDVVYGACLNLIRAKKL